MKYKFMKKCPKVKTKIKVKRKKDSSFLKIINDNKFYKYKF